MPEQTAMGPIKRVQIEATIIRANGTIEPLGLIGDSKWKWWSVRARLSARKIKHANKRSQM